MFRHYYHCFVAGLLDLGFDDGRIIPSLDNFRRELKGILHKSDFNQAVILFLPYDNKNLVKYFEGKSNSHDFLGNYSVEDFEEQINILDSIIKVDDILPEYMVTVMKEWLLAGKNIDTVYAERKLTEGYYKLATGADSRFLKRWSEFEMNISNILTMKSSMDLGLDVSDQIIGDNLLAAELRLLSRRKSDFRIPPEPDYASVVYNIAGESEFLDRELKIDMLKWNHVDNLVFFEYFNIDFILGYMIKLSIALRWKQLDAERGEQMLKALVAELKTKETSEAGEDTIPAFR